MVEFKSQRSQIRGYERIRIYKLYVTSQRSRIRGHESEVTNESEFTSEISDVTSQRSQVRGHKSEVASQRSQVKGNE